jgi:hypothetical protein
MAAKLIIGPDADQNIDEAYGWYELQRAGLGEEFLNVRQVPQKSPPPAA